VNEAAVASMVERGVDSSIEHPQASLNVGDDFEHGETEGFPRLRRLLTLRGDHNRLSWAVATCEEATGGGCN
jgi:hypothetical protein